MLRTVICRLVLYALLCTPAAGTAAKFSGVYHPNLQFSTELYAASWLIPKKLFMRSSAAFQSYIGNLEGATFSVMHDRRQFGAMTRDYFDMFVEHLSSYTNTVGAKQVGQVLIERMKKTMAIYRGTAPQSRQTGQHVDLPFKNNTIAIIPFSTKSHISQSIAEVRRLYFLLTYYSVCMHFPNIAVAVADEAHFRDFKSLDLPIEPFHVFKCYRQNETFQGHHLMKDMLIKTAVKLGKSARWSHFEFIYFTESDQILHMRREREIYDMMISNENNFYMVPHRLNVSRIFKVLFIIGLLIPLHTDHGVPE